MVFTLHSYWRATAPYRVRIGLALKGLAYDYVAVNLLEGVQRADAYDAVNRQHLVPALVTDDGVLTQSLAILEWLEETHPTPPLLPGGARERAVVRAMAEIVACDIHPLNNLRVMQAPGRARPSDRRTRSAGVGRQVDRRRLRGAGADGRAPWTRVRVRRDADHRRLLPRAADLVVEPVQRRPCALSGPARRLRPRRRASCVPSRPPRAPAGRTLSRRSHLHAARLGITYGNRPGSLTS